MSTYLYELVKLYDRLAEDDTPNLPAIGKDYVNLTFAINITKNGVFKGISDIRQTPAGKKKLMPRKESCLGQRGVRSGSKIFPYLLVDTSKYLLGVGNKLGISTPLNREASADYHFEQEDYIHDKFFTAVCQYFETTQEVIDDYLSEHPEKYDCLMGSGMFNIIGEVKPVHDMEQIKKWWARHAISEMGGVCFDESISCSITGIEGNPAKLHNKIKFNGDVLVLTSINFESLCKWGSTKKNQALPSRITYETMTKYAGMLNYLLLSKSRMRVGDVTYVWWTDEPNEIDSVNMFFNPPKQTEDEGTKASVDVSMKGSELKFNPKTRFHMLGLTTNIASTSVNLLIHSYEQSTLAMVAENIKHYNEYMDIGLSFPIRLGEVARSAITDVPWAKLNETESRKVNTAKIMLDNVRLHGGEFDNNILASLINRVYIDGTSYNRIAFITAILRNNYKLEIKNMLDTENTDTNYLLGRLLAVAEIAQEKSMKGKVNKSITDTLMKPMAKQPMRYIARLNSSLSTHLKKLKRDNGAVYGWLNKLVGEIMSGIGVDTIPTITNSVEQGMFILGYNHQKFFKSK